MGAPKPEENKKAISDPFAHIDNYDPSSKPKVVNNNLDNVLK